MIITADQLQTLREFADALDRLTLVSDQMAMPPAFHLKRIDKALAEMALQIKALCVVIEDGRRG